MQITMNLARVHQTVQEMRLRCSRTHPPTPPLPGVYRSNSVTGSTARLGRRSHDAETLVNMEPQEEPVVPTAFAGDQSPVLEAPTEGVVVLAHEETELLRGLARRSRGAGADLGWARRAVEALVEDGARVTLEEKLVGRLGYDKDDPASRNHGSSCNGCWSMRTVTGACGEVVIRCATGSGWHIRTADHSHAATSAHPFGRHGDQPVRQRLDHRRDQRPLIWGYPEIANTSHLGSLTLMSRGGKQRGGVRRLLVG